MVFPLTGIVVAYAATTVLLLNTVPRFEEMFKAASLPIPLPTAALIPVSHLLSAHPWAPVFGGILLLGATVAIILPMFRLGSEAS